MYLFPHKIQEFILSSSSSITNSRIISDQATSLVAFVCGLIYLEKSVPNSSSSKEKKIFFGGGEPPPPPSLSQKLCPDQNLSLVAEPSPHFTMASLQTYTTSKLFWNQ
jgi:hypothetical protein